MAIYKRDRGFKLGATEKQIQAVVSAAVHGSVKELAKMKTAVHRFH